MQIGHQIQSFGTEDLPLAKAYCYSLQLSKVERKNYFHRSLWWLRNSRQREALASQRETLGYLASTHRASRSDWDLSDQDLSLEIAIAASATRIMETGFDLL